MTPDPKSDLSAIRARADGAPECVTVSYWAGRVLGIVRSDDPAVAEAVKVDYVRADLVDRLRAELDRVNGWCASWHDQLVDVGKALGFDESKVPADEARRVASTIARLETELATALQLEVERGQVLDTTRQQLVSATAEVERFKTALDKIDAIRNDIVGSQHVNFSRDIYPLVAALGEAGYSGEGYDKARHRVVSYVSRIQELEAEVERLTTELAESKAQQHAMHETMVGLKGYLASEFRRVRREALEEAAKELESAAESYDKTAASEPADRTCPSSHVGKGMAAACRVEARYVRALLSSDGGTGR